MARAHNADANDYKQRLQALRLEHRDLDQVIERLANEHHIDQFQLQRMKKRKLQIKDQIALLENKLTPDLNA